MNKEYTFMEGQVIVRDESGHQTKREYFDKLPQVLVQENVIEVMEKSIAQLMEEYKKYQTKGLKHWFPTVTPLIAGGIILIPYIIVALSGGNASDIYDTYVHLADGTVLQSPITGQPLTIAQFTQMAVGTPCISASLLGDYIIYRMFRNSKSTSQGIDCQLDYLRTKLEIERATLEELQRTKTRERDYPIYATFKVDDEEALEHIRRQLALYNDLGYNVKKYYKYFERGELDVRLMGRYTASEIEEAQDFLEEKGPSLVYKNKKQEDTK